MSTPPPQLKTNGARLVSAAKMNAFEKHVHFVHKASHVVEIPRNASESWRSLGVHLFHWRSFFPPLSAQVARPPDVAPNMFHRFHFPAKRLELLKTHVASMLHGGCSPVGRPWLRGYAPTDRR